MSAIDRPVHAADPSERLIIVTEEPLAISALRAMTDGWADDELVVLIGPDDRLPMDGLSPGVDAAVSAALVTDAVKRVDASGRIVETLERSELRTLSLPAVTRIGVLRRALSRASDEAPLDPLAAVLDGATTVAVLADPR